MSVYAIEGGGLTYYGSTVKPLEERIYAHKLNYNKWLNNKYRYVSSFEIIKGEYTFRLIEKCKNYKERERWWIENNECVNRNIPLRTDEEKKEYKQNYLKKIETKY